MRRTVALVALGLLAAAAPVVLGTGADAEQEGGQLRQPREAGTIDVGKIEESDVVLPYLADGKQVLTYPESDYVKVHFSRLELAPGDYVSVSDPDGSQSYRYDGSEGPQWTTSVSGDTAVVKLHSGGGAVSEAASRLGVEIDKVARGLNNAEMAQQRREQPVPESVCGNDDQRDSVCYKSTDPKVYASTRPVARLLIGGTTLCTAWRVGEHNRLLTNNHCFDSTSQARDTEVWFDYACESCEGTIIREPVKVMGDKVIDTDKTYDYTLFTVADFKKIDDFGYLTLADRRARDGERLYIPQHPSGEPTKIAMDSDTDEGSCRVDQAVYDGYAVGSDVSYFCDTEFGSSGSPVISHDSNEVIALHHFGGCPNSGVSADRLMERIGDKI
jgi:lysyl endopeptidase